MPITHNFVSAAPPVADPTKVGSVEWNEAHTVSISDTDVAAGAAIAESKLSLNFATHAAVTLGTANGLSLSGQQLSLGLAGAGATGALSSADWSTFNSKQAALTFPLAANLGGTGIANAAGSTLTLGAATSITGGGTIVLGGFTLTIPATGTVALLNTANAFTAQQQITIATATNTGLILKTSDNSTAKYILDIQNSAGEGLLRVNGVGRLIGLVKSTDENISIYHQMETDINLSADFTSTENYAFDFLAQVQNTVLVYRSMTAIRALSRIGDDAIVNFMGTIRGGQFMATAESTSNIKVANLIGGEFVVKTYSSRASYCSNLAVAGKFIVGLASSTAHTTLAAVAIDIPAPTKNANITIDALYGLRIGNIDIGASNYAIYTNKGINRFGDQVSVVGWQDKNQLMVTGHTTQTLPVVYIIDNTGATNVVRNVLQLEVQSTGMAAAGLGAGLLFTLETATAGTLQNAGRISASWTEATNATRKAKLSLSAYDTAERLGLEIEASGSAAKLGFFGAAPALKQTLAAYSTDAESSAYTGIDNAQVGSVYAAVADLNALRAAYENLRASYDDLRTKLQTSTLVG